MAGDAIWHHQANYESWKTESRKGTVNMDHSTELQLTDFDFPFLLTFPNFLIKQLKSFICWNTSDSSYRLIQRQRPHPFYCTPPSQEEWIWAKWHHRYDPCPPATLDSFRIRSGANTKQSTTPAEEGLLLAGLTQCLFGKAAADGKTTLGAQSNSHQYRERSNLCKLLTCLGNAEAACSSWHPTASRCCPCPPRQCSFRWGGTPRGSQTCQQQANPAAHLHLLRNIKKAFSTRGATSRLTER